MITLSVPQNTIVLQYFNDDITMVKKYFNAIGFDFDDSFKYAIFKDFIFSAAGMFKEIDMGIYNKELLTKFQSIMQLDKAHAEFIKKSKFASKVYEQDFLNAQDEYKIEKKKYESLKAEIQLLIIKEQELNNQKKSYEERLKENKFVSKEEREEFEHTLKHIRRDHVDAVHRLGTSRKELEAIFAVLEAFENVHKAEFLEFFKNVKEKLDHQYKQSLGYFGYEFNKALFKNSERSIDIQKFKKESNIIGSLDLCRYVEYYLKNVNPDALADPVYKAKLNQAKEYCKRERERDNLF